MKYSIFGFVLWVKILICVASRYMTLNFTVSLFSNVPLLLKKLFQRSIAVTVVSCQLLAGSRLKIFF